MDCGGSGIECIVRLIGYFFIIFWPVILLGAFIGIISLFIKDKAKKSIEASMPVNNTLKKVHIIGCILYIVSFIVYHTYVMSFLQAKYYPSYVFLMILLSYLVLFNSRKYQWISFLIMLCMLLCWLCVGLFDKGEYLAYSSGTIIRYVGYFLLIIGLISCTYLYLHKRYYFPGDEITDLRSL